MGGQYLLEVEEVEYFTFYGKIYAMIFMAWYLL